MSAPITVIRLYPRETECIVCGVGLVDCRSAVPVYEDCVLPDDWAGEWAGFDACDACFAAQQAITEPTSFARLRTMAGGGVE